MTVREEPQRNANGAYLCATCFTPPFGEVNSPLRILAAIASLRFLVLNKESEAAMNNNLGKFFARACFAALGAFVCGFCLVRTVKQFDSLYATGFMVVAGAFLISMPFWTPQAVRRLAARETSTQHAGQFLRSCVFFSMISFGFAMAVSGYVWFSPNFWLRFGVVFCGTMTCVAIYPVLRAASVSTGSAATLPQDNKKPDGIKSLHDAIETASHIEKLLEAERLWIANRSSWLFTSQSFLLVAFVTFLGFGKETITTLGREMFLILAWGLPIVGLITCLVVGLGIFAAQHEAKRLANEGAKATRAINTFIEPIKIPLLGGAEEHRDEQWAYLLGEFPHIILPWVLTLLWIVLLSAILRL